MTSIQDIAYQISESTNRDGTVDVEIHSVEHNEDNGQIEISFVTPPHGSVETQTFDVPELDDAKYKIVTLARAYIGSFKYVEQLEGMTVAADPDTWEIQTPQSKLSRVVQVLSKISSSAVKPLVMVFVEVSMVIGLLLSIFSFIWIPLGTIVSMLFITSGSPLNVEEIIVLIISGWVCAIVLMKMLEAFFDGYGHKA